MAYSLKKSGSTVNSAPQHQQADPNQHQQGGQTVPGGLQAMAGWQAPGDYHQSHP